VRRAGISLNTNAHTFGQTSNQPPIEIKQIKNIEYRLANVYFIPLQNPEERGCPKNSFAEYPI